MPSCVFCNIISGKSPEEILYQDDLVTAFRDIHPVAPTHILIAPNQHIPSVNDLTIQDETLVGHMFTIARKLAVEEGVDQSGYRLIVNTGPDARQAVFHIHLHIIGGKRMSVGL